MQKINMIVQKHIFSVFRRMYGDEKSAYWERGILSKEIKSRAYTKSQDVEIDARLPLEAYLDFIEFKSIVEHKERWQLFKDVFDIPVDGEKGQAKNLKWMDRFNEIRRIPAHAAEGRNYKAEDFPFLESVIDILKSRIDDFDYDSITSQQ
ncbi:hypothetical protein ABB34_01100 [Stenotrophomonas daejeonensis]|uniref:RiboL-PSP-HEPN domain-containing protein n=1 Tax=Stenotrophomonas daejeonensis TaxID=659018 RepID=A0A0R0E1I8_9GAMM|nr:hypothetical protein ABB34_01100 [Stenotrophomonas daejeonensis]